MNVQVWTYIIVGITFALYIGIAIWFESSPTVFSGLDCIFGIVIRIA